MILPIHIDISRYVANIYPKGLVSKHNPASTGIHQQSQTTHHHNSQQNIPTYKPPHKQQHFQHRLPPLACPPRPPRALLPYQLGRLLRPRPLTKNNRDQKTPTHPRPLPRQSRLPNHCLRPRSLWSSSCDRRDAARSRRRPLPRTYCVRRRVEERDCCANFGGREGECFQFLSLGVNLR
jgi:hypothetical protein